MNDLLLEVANQKPHTKRGSRHSVCDVRSGHRGYIVTFDYGDGCKSSEFISFDKVYKYLWEQLCELRQKKS